MSENALGKADSSTDNSDKDSSVECPDCDQSWEHRKSVRYHLDNSDCEGLSCPSCDVDNFYNERGVKTHHKRVHGESLAIQTVYCSWCENELEKWDYQVEQQNNFFCTDEDCFSRWQSENRSGEDHPRWVEMVDVDCEWCGEALQRYPSRVSDKCFCPGGDCYQQWCEENFVGDGNPSYGKSGLVGEENHFWEGGKENLTCEHCGDRYSVNPHLVDSSRFCSRECMAEWQSENWAGESHPNWDGGGPWGYGTNWDEQSQKARERDNYQCQYCQKTQEENGRKLPVHHITPLRKFDSYKEANKLENLVSLCDVCHPIVEQWGLRPDTN